MLTDEECLEQQAGRRRIFWTTQPGACGQYSVCDVDCAIPGLEYVDSDTPDGTDRTIRNDEWLISLILNILNTRARNDTKCPTPAAVYGHWSESYRGDNLYIGSRMWNAAEKTYPRIGDSVAAVNAAIQADMAKLVAMKVADKVDVEASYAGRGMINVVIKAITVSKVHILDLSGTVSASGAWVWQ